MGGRTGIIPFQYVIARSQFPMPSLPTVCADCIAGLHRKRLNGLGECPYGEVATMR